MPSFPSLSVDGSVWGLNAVYATARSTATAHDVTSTYTYIGQYAPGIYVERLFLKFDTSTIGAAATVNQVNLKLTAVADFSATDFNVQICKCNWAAWDPIVAGNRDNAFDAALAAAVDVTWRNTAGMALNTPYTSPNMDTTWINKTGATYYALVSDRDKAGTAPVNGEDIGICCVEHGTAAYRPSLTVHYTIYSPYYLSDDYRTHLGTPDEVFTDLPDSPLVHNVQGDYWPPPRFP